MPKNKNKNKTYESRYASLRCHVQSRSEKEPVPSNVGTSAALGAVLPTLPCEGEEAVIISCFRSLTKWSFSIWEYLDITDMAHDSNPEKKHELSNHNIYY